MEGSNSSKIMYVIYKFLITQNFRSTTNFENLKKIELPAADQTVQ